MNTNKEDVERDIKEIANYKDKNTKLSWARKRDKLEALVETLAPYEDEIMAIMAKRQVIIDEIQAIREVMTVDCIHPKDLLVHKDHYVECKFCNAKIRLNR